MQLIPVLDIKGGQMVHAMGGQREKYQAVTSKLFQGSDPVIAVHTLYDLGFNCFYVADLDAITRKGDNFELIKRLLLDKEITLWLDSGIADGVDALGPNFGDLCSNKQTKLIVGSETLKSFENLDKMACTIGYDRITFSLDIAGNRVLSPNHDIAASKPADVARTAYGLGINEIIIIDLINVGTGSGPNLPLIENLVLKIPDAAFYPGGGVRNTEDLKKLEELNVAGTLVATALHNGNINGKQWVGSG